MKKAKLKASKKGILFFDRVSYGDDERRIVEIAEKKNFDLLLLVQEEWVQPKRSFWEAHQTMYFINQRSLYL